MMPDGWRYYNHALITTCAPDETPDTSILQDKTLWKQHKGALLAQWTEDFDCGYETGWYYIIKYGPFLLDELDAKVRKHIRQAQKKVEVRQIKPWDYAEELCEVYNAACMRYDTCSDHVSADDFKDPNDTREYFGAFSIEDNTLVGYMMCRRHQRHVDTVSSKFHPQYLNLRASDALHYAVLNHYLNVEGFEYVCSGSRNINHKTNVQNYKVDNFQFRRVYCRLCIAYHPKIKWAVKLLYPFRKMMAKLDRIGAIHKINGIMKMEEIVRSQKQ